MKDINDKIDVLEQENSTIKKSLVGNYRTEEEVKEAVKELEYRHKTGAFKSLNEENQLIKHIDAVKASLPKAKRFSEL